MKYPRKMENLILDSHKLSNHLKELKLGKKGKRVPPVTVDMALTRACGAMCSLLCNGTRTTRKIANQNTTCIEFIR